MFALFMFDPMYFVYVGPFILIAMWASARVKSTFHRFSQVGVRSGMSGAEAAAAVARAAGLEVDVTAITGQGDVPAEGSVRIEQVGGFLSDHYDPRSRTLRLSPDVYHGKSVSSIAVAAHEVGHAIQHAHNYVPLTIRSQMVPIAMIGSQAWIWIFIAGMIANIGPLQIAGIILFGVTVVFQLVTLPVEFDASNRAKAVLAGSGIVSTEEEELGVAKVLNAAAMTYVAAALTSIATLVYLLIRRD